MGKLFKNTVQIICCLVPILSVGKSIEVDFELLDYEDSSEAIKAEKIGNIEKEDKIQMKSVSIQSVPQESFEIDQSFDNNPNFQLKNKSSSLDGSSLDKMNGWSTNFYLFGQLEIILPGGGLAVRTQKNSVKFEGTLSFILNLNPVIKSAVSLIKNFDDSGKGWYMGFGAGAFIALMDRGTLIELDLPVFLGYQMAYSFWDIGVDFLPLSDLAIPLPVLRVGLGF